MTEISARQRSVAIWIFVMGFAGLTPALVRLGHGEMSSFRWMLVWLLLALGAALLVRAIRRSAKPIVILEKRWQIAVCLFVMGVGLLAPGIVFFRHGYMTWIRWVMASYFFAFGAVMLLRIIRQKC
jgi:hypothetical protein